MVPEPLRKGNCLLSVTAGLKVESFPELIIRARVIPLSTSQGFHDF